MPTCINYFYSRMVQTRDKAKTLGRFSDVTENLSNLPCCLPWLFTF